MANIIVEGVFWLVVESLGGVWTFFPKKVLKHFNYLNRTTRFQDQAASNFSMDNKQ